MMRTMGDEKAGMMREGAMGRESTNEAQTQTAVRAGETEVLQRCVSVGVMM